MITTTDDGKVCLDFGLDENGNPQVVNISPGAAMTMLSCQDIRDAIRKAALDAHKIRRAVQRGNSDGNCITTPSSRDGEGVREVIPFLSGMRPHKPTPFHPESAPGKIKEYPPEMYEN